jgi:hypothetical protein
METNSHEGFCRKYLVAPRSETICAPRAATILLLPFGDGEEAKERKKRKKKIALFSQYARSLVVKHSNWALISRLSMVRLIFRNATR